MKLKIFQWMKFLFRHSPNSRNLSRKKFHNELTAHLYASKNADLNQQQLTDGGVLANRKSANHPYCFLSNQKKVQILAFLHVICERNASCPLPETDYRDKGWGHDRRLVCSLKTSLCTVWAKFNRENQNAAPKFLIFMRMTWTILSLFSVSCISLRAAIFTRLRIRCALLSSGWGKWGTSCTLVPFPISLALRETIIYFVSPESQ